MANKEKSFDELVKSIPRKISTADVFMNLNKLPPQHGRQLEAADKVETQGEGDSLMGRLAMRMASRDMIDELNLGPKGASPEVKKAAVADMSFPTKMCISGPAKASKKETADAFDVNKLYNTDKVRKGSNMAEQARASGNVFDTMNDRDIEQQKSLPNPLFKKK